MTKRIDAVSDEPIEFNHGLLDRKFRRKLRELQMTSEIEAMSWPTQSTSESLTNAIPWWTAIAAGTAPVLFVCGFPIAAALQPTSYDPIRDTISSLAAKGATDRWAMTAALVGVGLCCLLTAFGLRPARHAGRAALAGGGLATLLIATFPTPLHGYSRSHALAVIAASTTMCAWPVMAAHRRHRARVLTFPPNVAATAVTFGLMMWFAFASELHSGELGLAERCAAVAPALWLFPVTFMTRKAVAQERSPQTLQDESESARLPNDRMSALIEHPFEVLPGEHGQVVEAGGAIEGALARP